MRQRWRYAYVAEDGTVLGYDECEVLVGEPTKFEFSRTLLRSAVSEMPRTTAPALTN